MPSTVVVQCVCGGTLRVIACIEAPELIERILTHRVAGGTGWINHPPHTAAAYARSRTPGHPITERILTASTGAQRPRRASPPAPGPTACLAGSHRCRFHQIASPRPRNGGARTANEPVSDHINIAPTTQIGRLSCLSFTGRMRSVLASASARRWRSRSAWSRISMMRRCSQTGGRGIRKRFSALFETSLNVVEPARSAMRSAWKWRHYAR